jgi:hypothetical protein
MIINNRNLKSQYKINSRVYKRSSYSIINIFLRPIHGVWGLFQGQRSINEQKKRVWQIKVRIPNIINIQ